VLGLLLRRLHQHGKTLRDLGWGRPTSYRSFALAIGIAILYSGYTILGNPLIARHLLEISAFKLIGIGAAVVAGMVEETVFRGYVMTTLNAMGYRQVVQVLNIIQNTS
jgi:membrane protease YdiL (CAAX protease family)